MNVTLPLGGVISSKLASLYELDNFLGVEDMWNLLEVATVDSHNMNNQGE